MSIKTSSDDLVMFWAEQKVKDFNEKNSYENLLEQAYGPQQLEQMDFSNLGDIKKIMREEGMLNQMNSLQDGIQSSMNKGNAALGGAGAGLLALLGMQRGKGKAPAQEVAQQADPAMLQKLVEFAKKNKGALGALGLGGLAGGAAMAYNRE